MLEKELVQYQSKMLYLQREKAQAGLNLWYEKTQKYFYELALVLGGAKKGEPEFLYLNQCNLILKNLATQKNVIENIMDIPESEIILLLEKQFKLKKNIRKFAENRFTTP